jgi:co-chaperonin GroES (HSP10)
MIENQSGLEPRGVAVLLQVYEPERKGSMIVIPDTVKDRMAMADTRATVIAVGPGAWYDEAVPRAVPGERVLVTKYAGFTALGPKDGKSYRLVNDRDIFCAITHEGGENA